LSDDWQSPAQRERRATDGLDWLPPNGGSAATTDGDPEGPVQADGAARSKLRGGPGRRLVVVLALAAGLIGGIASGGTVAWLLREDTQPTPTAYPTPQGSTLTVQQTSVIVDVAAKWRPAVVRIESTHHTQVGVETDIGSGVVLDAEGHILTNAHVVTNAETLKVVLFDGTERPGIVVGTDFPFTDVAVVQIGPGKLTPIETGDSGELALGETVIAIGNPLAQFDGSVNVGVVSGLHRTRVFDAVRQDDLIQTDAAINNGNSGGALLNLRGQFVGIPTAVLRQTPGGLPVEGIAFVLPSNRVIPIAQKIIADGASYPRPSLAADTIDISGDLPRGVNRTGLSDGAIVATVASGGAAATAGILPGDVITRFGDKDVNQANPLLNALMLHQAGDTVRVVLNRNGRIIETDVRLAKRA
jgi:S1-C subfamily serine protease